VVEFFTPNGQAAGNLLWVGSNPDGQTSPTYLAAADCGVPEPTDTAALGFPGMHMVMNVTGDTDAGPATCDAPDDIPWASVAPDNGSTAPGDTDTVTVTFDSTGLAAGTYNAALCVTSNDPDPGPGNGTELVVVDLELTVEEAADEPNIDVDPLSMSSTQNTNNVVVQPLDVSNTGTADLDWNIDEEAPVAVPTAPFGAPGAALSDHGSANASVPDVVQGPVVSGPTILVDQPPNQVNGYFSDSGCDLCAGQQSIADNFFLAAPASITEIVMWSGYFPTNNPVPDVITLKFHTDGGGIPGAEIYSESPVASSRMTTGVILFGVEEYVHTLTLAAPLNLAAGTYWVEIYNATGFGTDDWFWETGNVDPVAGIPGSAFAFTTPGSGWNAQADDLSFQLIAGGGPQVCDTLGNIPWLSVNPDAGTTGPGGTTTVDVTFDSTGLAAGTYNGNLCITSNDPDPGPGNGTELVVVPVELIVEQPTDVSLSGISGDAPTGMLPLMLSLLAVLAVAFGLIARRRSLAK
jgi:hypothetical protein